VQECDVAYFLIGGVARVRIEESFAKIDGASALAMIAERFTLQLDPGQTIVPEPKMTLRPKCGIMMTVWHRNQVGGASLHK